MRMKDACTDWNTYQPGMGKRQVEKHTAHPSRLEKDGDMGRSYSADKIMAGGIRGHFTINGACFVCTGSMSREHVTQKLWAIQVRPEATWNGPKPETYEQRQLRQGRAEMNQRSQERRSYEGILVMYHGERLVLGGRNIEVTPDPNAKKEVQDSLF